MGLEVSVVQTRIRGLLIHSRQDQVDSIILLTDSAPQALLNTITASFPSTLAVSVARLAELTNAAWARDPSDSIRYLAPVNVVL